MKNTLILIGSPRKKGSTAILAAEAARAVGDQVQIEKTSATLSRIRK